MILLFVVVIYGGYFFPLFGLAMSWWEWFKLRASNTTSATSWRRVATVSSLSSLTAAIPLWVYGAFHEIRDDYSYIFKSAQIGRWSSLYLCDLTFRRSQSSTVFADRGCWIAVFFGGTIGELP